MKHVQLSIGLTDELKLKTISININTTGLAPDSKLIKSICMAILLSYERESDSIATQDLLNELNIKTSKEKGEG